MTDDTKTVQVRNPRTGTRYEEVRMTRSGVRLGGEYLARSSGEDVTVRIERASPEGGWEATNLATGRKIRIKTADRLRPLVTPEQQQLTMFSFGYKGWGPATELLVEVVDAVEKSRGHAPPMFVDIRFRREVRAEGFRGDSFGRLLGERYQWMKGLGNESIATHAGMQKIARPEDAGLLLDLAIECDKRGQRVIFFCSCSTPSPYCHRNEVSSLLAAAARSRNLALEVLPWPAIGPRYYEMDLDERQFRALKRGAEYLPLPKEADLVELGQIPYFSQMRCSFGAETRDLLVSSIIRRDDAWFLPIWGSFDGVAAPEEIEEFQKGLLEDFGVHAY